MDLYGSMGSLESLELLTKSPVQCHCPDCSANIWEPNERCFTITFHSQCRIHNLKVCPQDPFKPVPTVARNVMRLFWWNLLGNSISSVWPMPPPTLLRVWSSGNVNQREGRKIHRWWKAMGPNHYRLWIGLRSWTLRLQSDSFSNLWNGHPQVIQHCNGNPHVQPVLHPQNNDVPWS